MNTLVTGGTGFIGRALCTSLLASGQAVTVLTRNPDQARQQLPATVCCVGRLDDARDIDSVINLQGENLADGRWNERRKAEFLSSRVDFTRELVSWIRRQPRPPQVLVNGSAIGWYGNRGDETLSESSTAGEDFPACLCRAWEEEACRAESLGVRVCRLRIGVVLDPAGGALAKMLPAFRLGGGGPLGTGRQWMSWITRRDLVRLIFWLLETPTLAGAFNGTAPHPVRNREFATTLGRVLKRPARLPMPAFVLRLMFGEMSRLLLGSQRVSTAATEAAGFAFEDPELEPALRALLRK
ncbi:MAG: TIGR01777 family oxidoreductase [Panacagrimonas sp.]